MSIIEERAVNLHTNVYLLKQLTQMKRNFIPLSRLLYLMQSIDQWLKLASENLLMYVFICRQLLTICYC